MSSPARDAGVLFGFVAHNARQIHQNAAPINDMRLLRGSNLGPQVQKTEVIYARDATDTLRPVVQQRAAPVTRFEAVTSKLRD